MNEKLGLLKRYLNQPKAHAFEGCSSFVQKAKNYPHQKRQQSLYKPVRYKRPDNGIVGGMISVNYQEQLEQRVGAISIGAAQNESLKKCLGI